MRSCCWPKSTCEWEGRAGRERTRRTAAPEATRPEKSAGSFSGCLPGGWAAGRRGSYFCQQIEKTPGQAKPYLLLGLIQRQQQKNEEARHSFEKVLELAPDNIEALNQLVGNT